jgi:PleD family two-component response regulator
VPDAAHEEMAVARKQIEKAASPWEVLLVDDDAENLSALQSALQSAAMPWRSPRMLAQR